MATLRRGDDAPVAGGERVAEYLPDKGIHTHGELPDHIGVALDVGESPAIKRLFPKGDNAKSRVAVGNTHLIRGEIAASLGLLHIFPRGTALFGEKVFGLGGSKRCVEVGNIKRRHFDVFQHFVQRYRSLFASLISAQLATLLGVNFYEDLAECHSKHRVGAVFTLVKALPTERNIIVFDDFVTTGATMLSMRDLLQPLGYNLIFFTGINNKL